MSDTIRLILNSLFIYNASFAKCYIYSESCPDNIPVLEPVLNYKLNLPAGADPVALLSKLRTLEEEEPELHVEWDENFKEIHVSVMGPVLIEVLVYYPRRPLR